MNTLDAYTEKLKRSLDGHLEPEIRFVPGDIWTILGVIVSKTFEGMDEADRQEIVWDRVLKTFDADERRRIEFLYTDAPSEVESGPASAKSK